MRRLFCVLLMICLVCGALASCAGTPTVESEGAKRYKITFETNGGSAIAPKELGAGEALTPPADPVKEGFVFAGWYADTLLTSRYTFEKMPEKDLLLYAKWEALEAPADKEDDLAGAKRVCEGCGVLADCAPVDHQDGVVYLCAACRDIWEKPSEEGTEEDTENDAENSTDTQAPGPFCVTFCYIDPNGNAMANGEGETKYRHDAILRGERAENAVENDILSFADYVIVGWNEDEGKARAGVADAGCTENIDRDKTLYSVVREKYLLDVTFLRADGSVFQVLKMKEGSAVDRAVARPAGRGAYFKNWMPVGDSLSTLSCIRENCTFMAVMGSADGTIGKVAAGSVALDGVKDDAYVTSGAYLPHNATLQADRSDSRAQARVSAGTYIVWDGDAIYLLIEVSDKTLVGRSSAYTRRGVDTWLNDTVEVWYSLEQDLTLAKNETRVGIDAMGRSKYAPPRSGYGGRVTGIGGGRSTHYDEIEYAVRNCLLGDTGSDLSRTGYVNNAVYYGTGEEPAPLASYIVEVKIPARTEGKADTAKGAKPSTGLLPERDPASNNGEDYAFTAGEPLLSGDFVRFNLKINDLMLSPEDLTGEMGRYFWDSPPADAVNGWAGAAKADHTSLLYRTDGVGNIVGVADIDGVFSASGATERELTHYVMFALGNDEEAYTAVYAMGNKRVEGTLVPTMLTADGSEYVRE